jgi:hypothetical protein
MDRAHCKPSRLRDAWGARAQARRMVAGVRAAGASARAQARRMVAGVRAAGASVTGIYVLEVRRYKLQNKLQYQWVTAAREAAGLLSY